MITKPNTLRAEHVDAVLQEYCPRSSPTENLIDILADAMHWCFLHGENFDALLNTARMHIEFESRGRSCRPVVPGKTIAADRPQIAIGLRPLATELLELSASIDDFALQRPDQLTLDDYNTLKELKLKLIACTNLPMNAITAKVLARKIQKVERLLIEIRSRLGAPD